MPEFDNPPVVPTDAESFDSITLANLTANRLAASDGLKKVVSVPTLTAWVAGTANQVSVADDGDGSVTLSLPSAMITPGTLTVTGVLAPEADNTRDLGSAAARWRDVYSGRQFIGAAGAVGTPSYTFTGFLTTGWFASSAAQVTLSMSGTARFDFASTSFSLRSDGILSWSATTDPTASKDVFLRRAGAGVLQQSNTGNAQTYYLFNLTDSDTTPVNLERAFIGWTANIFTIQTQAGGTGVFRNMMLNASGGTLTFSTSGSSRWNMSGGGHLLANTDNTLDIGASAATRPRSVYAGTSFLAPDGAVGAPGFSFAGATTGGLYRNADGSIHMAHTSNSLACWYGQSLAMGSNIQLGWTSGSFAPNGTQDVILKRSAAAVLALANGTNAQTLRVYGNETGPKYSSLAHDGTDANLDSVGGGSWNIKVAGTTTWAVTSSKLLAATDNTLDIGSSGANRPRSLYWGTQALGSDGTATNPSWSFASETNSGVWRVGAGSMGFVITGTTRYSLSTADLRLGSAMALSWASGDPSATSADLKLFRGAADVLQQSRTTNSQSFYVYKTTDSDSSPTNYERLIISGNPFADGNLGIVLQKGGSGGDRNFYVSNNTTGALIFRTTNLNRWQMSSNGHMIGDSDNTVDLGSSGANRPRSLFLATSLVVSANATVTAVTTNGVSNWVLSINGTLTGSPADFNLRTIIPTLAGAFTVTRLNYFDLNNVAGAATVTDAAVFRFDAAVGTHKCLASPAAVAVTLGTGPTGANAGNPLGWMKVNVNGTLRYTPFW